jgi:hypothetical protein
MAEGQQAVASDIFSIVVVGAMNPRIHQPQWYRMIGAIDESELQAAQNTQMVISQAISQFRFSSDPVIAIVCAAEQWNIQSNSDAVWDRMLKIASITFSKLSETPISAYAFNVQKHFKTDLDSVKDELAEAISGMGLGFPVGKSIGSIIHTDLIEDDYKIHVSVQPSLNGESSVFIAYNSEYQAPAAPSGGYFDLGRLMSGRFAVHQEKSKKVMGDVVASINKRVRQKQLKQE